MVAHLVSYSHKFKEFYGDLCANMTPLGAAVTPLFYSIACKASIAELSQHCSHGCRDVCLVMKKPTTGPQCT